MAKPKKVEEPAGTYAVSLKRPVASPIPLPTSDQAAERHASPADVRKVNARLMQIHRKVLQKLAQ